MKEKLWQNFLSTCLWTSRQEECFVTCLKILTVTPSPLKALFHCGHIVHIVNYIIRKMTKWSKDSKSKIKPFMQYVRFKLLGQRQCWTFTIDTAAVKGNWAKRENMLSTEIPEQLAETFLPRWCQPSRSQTGKRTLRPTVLIWGVQQVKVSLQEHTQDMTQQGSSIPSPIKIKSTSIIVKHPNMLSKVNLGLA